MPERTDDDRKLDAMALDVAIAAVDATTRGLDGKPDPDARQIIERLQEMRDRALAEMDEAKEEPPIAAPVPATEWPDGEPLTEERLREMIRDPRYWRDRDPEHVQRVSKGYLLLYQDTTG